MKVYVAAIFAVWAGTGLAHAGDQLTPAQLKEVEAICAKTTCRAGGYDVAVGVDKEHYTNVPVSRSPYVTPDGDILIFPGETIAVQFTVSGNTLSQPRFIAQYATDKALALKIDTGDKLIDNPLDGSLPPTPGDNGNIKASDLPPNTLLIRYGQFSDHTGMAANLDTNLAHTLKLDAAVSEIGKSGYEWHYTSSCPLASGRGSNESWSNALGPVRFSNFRFLADDAENICK